MQYRVAEPGEVLSAGGRVLNMVDLSDVYMTFFLPTEQAGLLKIGGESATGAGRRAGSAYSGDDQFCRQRGAVHHPKPWKPTMNG
ncbi:membrane protein [Salmonella enterica subsp. enterica]|uniref:Membrane protein n=1 Tax=Salmonella enterica I TaxID=59201 RepID=A0A3S5DMB9_SALET|nr:membrane protein [Salmonella enterica subsp. enterica]